MTRLTERDIENMIDGETYFTGTEGVLGAYKEHGDVYQGTNPHSEEYGRLTICVLALHNGFLVVGTSACVNLADFNEEKGRTAARAAAIEKVWELAGFARKHEAYLNAEQKEPT